MTDIFISYRREDSEADAWRLFGDLEARLDDMSVFMDQERLSKGRDFRAELQEHLDSVRTVLVLIGPNWLGAANRDTGQRRLYEPEDFVCFEIATALSQGKRVIPVLLLGARMPRANELPESIRDLAYCNAYPIVHRFWSLCIDELIAEIRGEGKAKAEGLSSRAKLRTASIMVGLAVSILMALHVSLMEANLGLPMEWLLGVVALALGFHASRFGFTPLQLGSMAGCVSTIAALSANGYVYVKYGESFIPKDSAEFQVLANFVGILFAAYLVGALLKQALSRASPINRSWR